MKHIFAAFCTPIHLFLSVLFTFVICSASDVTAVESNDDSPQVQQVIRMASIYDAMPGVNTEDARMAVEMLMRDIMERRGNRFRIRLDFLMEFDQAAEKITTDRYDLVVLPGLDYLQIEPKVALVPRLVLSRVNQPTEPLVLVTRHNETLKSLTKKKMRILMVDVGRFGETAKLWLDTVLLEAGLGPSHQFFSEIRRTQKPSQSILPVFFGQVTACVITESALNVIKELNPQIERRVQILKRSGNLVTLLLCATPWADKKDVDMVVAEGLKAIHDPKSRQALTIVQMNRFYPFQPEYMDATRDLYERFLNNMKTWGQ
jgi:phosphonate transport system substrate-binding protein